MKLKNLLLCLLCTVNFVTTYAQDRANSWSFSVLTDDIQLKKLDISIDNDKMWLLCRGKIQNITNKKIDSI